MNFSRRGFLKGLAAITGSAIGTRVAGGSWIESALAASSEPTSVVLLHMIGGYNAMFASAASLVGSFGVTNGNYTALGSGVSMDNSLANALPAFAKSHIATIGVKHGISNHPSARTALWTSGTNNAGAVLADAMGGTAAIKAAVVGGNLVAEAPKAAYKGISFQAITDLQKTVDALGGGTSGARTPDRGIAAAALADAQAMNANAYAASPNSLASLNDGLATAIDGLKQPVQTFDLAAIKTAYGTKTDAVKTFADKLAAAELMVRAGTNVVSVFDREATSNGWDSHGDIDGSQVRGLMTANIATPLQTFLTRMVADPTRNVVVAIFGDFSRSLPHSDHQPNLSATVIGKYVKMGTTGKVDANVGLAAGTPSVDGFWAYLAAAAKASGSPFGANPHNLVL